MKSLPTVTALLVLSTAAVIGCVDSGELPVDADGGSVDAQAPDSGTDAGCVFVSAEDCFNGVDDDCNGQLDCADSACGAIGTCVPASAGAHGLLVPMSESCPIGYSAVAALLLHQGLDGGAGCEGCSCAASFTCSAQLFEYASRSECPGGRAALVGTPRSDTCLELRGAAELDSGAARLGPPIFDGTCAPSGTPTLTSASWTTTQQFCVADSVGGGCTPGNVCLRQDSGSTTYCEATADAESCSPGFAPVAGGDWYEGFADGRSCGACECGERGGDCRGAQVRVWTASGCSGGFTDLNGGDNCSLAMSFGYDSADVSSAGSAPTCTASSTPVGTLDAAMHRRVCCQ